MYLLKLSFSPLCYIWYNDSYIVSSKYSALLLCRNLRFQIYSGTCCIKLP